MSGVMTLPNLVTASRLLALPLIWWGVFQLEPLGWIVALVAAIYAELTDLADGWLARKLGQTSEFGAMLDPLVDSLYRFGAFAALAGSGIIPVWSLIIFAWRDVIVAYARIQLQAAGQTIGARLSGKLKAIIQGAAILAILADGVRRTGQYSGWSVPSELVELIARIGTALFWIAALITAWSAFDYAYAAYRASRDHPNS